jgi:undecaprenyl-diphosphatase
MVAIKSSRCRFFIVPLILTLLFTGGYVAYTVEEGNFHSITPGEAYRSAQLDKDELEYYIKKNNIKSILNLRGQNLNTAWYTEETKVSRDHNVAHYDISLSAFREPSEEDVKKLIAIFKSAPRPILIHCEGGADRSGLVAAMWKVVVDKEPKSDAEKQLSVLYGHIPIGGKYAMDRFFRKWDPVYIN